MNLSVCLCAQLQNCALNQGHIFTQGESNGDSALLKDQLDLDRVSRIVWGFSSATCMRGFVHSWALLVFIGTNTTNKDHITDLQAVLRWPSH